MSTFDELLGYDVNNAFTAVEKLSLFPSTVRAPYMLFDTTVILTKTIRASVLLSKHYSHFQFYDSSDNGVQVIFDSEDNHTRVTLFEPTRCNDEDSGIQEFDGVNNIPDEILSTVNLTRQNLKELQRIFTEMTFNFINSESPGYDLV